MKTIVQRQFDNEELAINIGIDNYIHSQIKAENRHDQVSLSPENYLLRTCILKVTENIRKHVLHHRSGPPSFLNTRKTVIAATPEATAFITLKTCLDYTKQTGLTTVALKVAAAIQMHLDHKVFKKAMPGYVNAIEKTMNSKTSSYKINVLRNHMGKQAIPTFKMEGKDAAVSLGTYAIYKMLESIDLFELAQIRKGKKTVKVIQPTPLTLQWLENAHNQCAEMCVQFLPMLVKPAKWESMYSGGYLNCAGQYKIPAVRAKHQSTFSELEKYDSMQGVYDALNHVQATPFKINKKILEVMDVCKEFGDAGLPSPSISLNLPQSPSKVLGV